MDDVEEMVFHIRFGKEVCSNDPGDFSHSRIEVMHRLMSNPSSQVDGTLPSSGYEVAVGVALFERYFQFLDLDLGRCVADLGEFDGRLGRSGHLDDGDFRSRLGCLGWPGWFG